jgi:hypothetical protein
MNDEGPHRRRERKHPLSVAELLQFRGWQRGPGRVFAPAHPTRTVNNIYFDSPDWANYSDNLSGVSDRAKCRLRWYGELETAEEATFEAKHRRNAIGHKRQQRVPLSELHLRSLPIGRLYERLRELLRADLRLQLDQGHRPVLYNRFRREYYEASNGLRMTVDTDIAYAPLHGRPLPALRPTPGATAAVVEFKYPWEQRREAEETLRRLPFRATRFSKYVVGIDHHLPH